MGIKKNKNHLVDEIAKELSLDSKTVRDVVNLFFDKIKETLLQNGKVMIKGFGTFDVRKAKARVINNLQEEDTNARRYVKKRYLPKFKYSGPFVNKVKETLKI